jgi:hypothetical protein
MPILNLPSDYAAWGGNPPIPIASYDGAVIWGLNTKDSAGAYAYTVWRQLGDAEAVHVPLGPAGGQGALVLQSNGQLWVSAFTTAGDGAQAVAYQIVAYTPFPTRFDRFLAGLKALVVGT